MRLKSPAILEAHMAHAGLTASNLATRAGCSRQFIYQLINGDRVSCSDPLARDISKALKAPLASVFDPTASAGRGRNSGHRQTASAT